MEQKSIKELLIYRKDVVLKSVSDKHLEEKEYLYNHLQYTPTGKLKSEIQFNEQGEMMHRFDLAYDDKDRIISEKMTENDDIIAEHKTYEYNEAGQISKEFRHYMDGSFDTVTYFYDENNNLLKREIRDDDGDLENTEHFVFQDDAMVHFWIEDEEGEKIYEKKNAFNDKGDPTVEEEIDYHTDTHTRKETEYHPTGSKKAVYTYHNQQLTEKVIIKEDAKSRPLQITEETPLKKNNTHLVYDEKGNITEQEEIDKTGEIASKVSRIFNEEGKLIESDVFIDGGGRGFSRSYKVRHEYLYF